MGFTTKDMGCLRVLGSGFIGFAPQDFVEAERPLELQGFDFTEGYTLALPQRACFFYASAFIPIWEFPKIGGPNIVP